MKRFALMLLLIPLLMVACGGQAEPTPTAVPTSGLPTSTPPPTATLASPQVTASGTDTSHPGLALPIERGTLFSTSGTCAICHSNMTDSSGADVSIDSSWRASMMANAASDPFWQAALRREGLLLPDLQPSIEDQCAECHTPMAQRTALNDGETVTLTGEGFLDPQNDYHVMAMDGVSCTLCHQITDEKLGLPASYSGGYIIDLELPQGERLAYGQYTVDQAEAETMQNLSGFIPVQGLHIARAEICATCHTVYTPSVDDTGRVVDLFPLQVPYIEWFYSGYRRIASCQVCHMPEAQGGVRISTTSTTLRGPFSEHTFVGGNTYMLEVLQTFADELQLTASGKHFDSSIERTQTQLQNEAVTVVVDNATIYENKLYIDVSLENLAGHKFPTGFPSRRVWLHFMVRDASGALIFESGAYNPDGSIVGNNNDEDPQSYEPHHTIIGSTNQVQIYEIILRDSERNLTTSILRAHNVIKDNRLMPWRSEKTAPWEDVAVRGEAFDDEDFQGGVDSIQYVVDVGSAQGPFDISVEVLYQSVGFRWAENLRGLDAAEIERFLEYYDAVPNIPEVVATATYEPDDDD
ncbi:MAG TPA: hypothetical protein G4O08_09435 [Anaerolineae bacterium]|nr:hypothetical protein [Anaerolineae bacterium]